MLRGTGHGWTKGRRVRRVGALAVLAVAAATIGGGGGTSALGDGTVTITISQNLTPIASSGAAGDFNLIVKATNNTGSAVSGQTADLTLSVPSGVSLTGSSSVSLDLADDATDAV